MTTVRLLTNIRRMRALKVYTLEPSVTAVPCLADGVAKDDSFTVSLYLSENNRDKTPCKARMRYRRCNGQSCESTSVPAPVSSVTVPTGKSSGAVYDRYVIEAYEARDGKEAVLATATVQTVLDGAQGQAGVSGLIVPYGSWAAGRTYRSTQDVKIFVERLKMYYVLVRTDEDCLGVDPATDTKNEWWRLMDYVEFVFVRAMMAEFGKIASTVFTGHYTISQYGTDADGNPVQTENGYEDFGKADAEGRPLFRPNILIDWLNGRVEARGKDSVFGGSLEAVKGTFEELSCANGQGQKIVLSPSGAGSFYPSIRLVDSAGNNVFEITYSEYPSTGASLQLMRYDDRGTETNHVSLHANGVYSAMQADGRRVSITPTGIVFANGNTITLRYPAERKVLVCTGGTYNTDIDVDFIRIKGGTNEVYFPSASAARGHTFYIKKTDGDVRFKSRGGPLYGSSEWQQSSEYKVNGTIAMMAKSDGEGWFMFFCG